MSGGKFKAWHILIFIAAIVALGYGAWRLVASGKSDINWAQTVYGVDVATGQLFSFNVSKKGVVFPAENPETHQSSIIPASLDSDTGQWHVEGRYLSIVRGLVNPKVVDSSGKVTTTGEPQRVD